MRKPTTVQKKDAGVEGTPERAHLAVPGRQPLYEQVKDLMVGHIASGKWAPGELLPSEIALAEEFGVSQGTVRKALNELEAQYLVVRRQGRGTFVSEHTPQHSLFHFFHIVADDGERVLPTSVVVSQRSKRATRDEAQKLRIEVRSALHDVTRVRYLGGKPVLLEHLLMPAELFPGLRFPIGEEMTEELYVLYQQRFHVMVSRTEERLRAVAANEQDAEHLQIAVGAPLLEMERIALDIRSRPVELRTDRCNTTNHHYLVKIE